MNSIARARSFAFSGIAAVPVEVQVQIAPGLPTFQLVGLADKAVGEARERVRAALTAMGLALPPRRVLINLAPADLAKEGSHFDLPIALGVLAAMDILPREEIGRMRATLWNAPRKSFASPRAAIRACCAWRAPSPISAAPPRSAGKTWLSPWPSGSARAPAEPLFLRPETG